MATCANCPKPPLFEVPGPGESKILLCLDCYIRLQSVLEQDMARSVQMMNFCFEAAEHTVGLPGLLPRVPAIPTRHFIHQGDYVNIDRSNVGLVNTGHIDAVESAVGTIKGAGNPDLAAAFQALTQCVVADAQADTEFKVKALELLSALSSEGTLPPERRRKSVLRPLLTEFSELAKQLAPLAQMYQQWAPVLQQLVSG
jgi:hypothetical protein